MKKIYGICGVLTVLAACASGPDLDKMSAEELYNHAFDQLEATRYKKAAEAFEKVETDHPYSKWAVKSKLMGAYAYYKDEKYDDAVIAADRFLRYHPGNKDAAYAYYLKGMCYYDQISSADRDQGDTQLAEDTFARLVALYPESKYAQDVRNKLHLAEDYKAGQEMIIGRFYLKEGNYLSALNRFNVVLNEYQTTIQIEEALYREVEIYAIFGMNKYADGYYKILKQNYPDGKWTAKAEKVMEKIGGKDGTEKSKSWYSKWRDESKAEKVAKPEEESAQEESKSWFSGWFGGSDENAEEVAASVEEVKVEAEEKADEGKSWFSGWFGGSDDKAEEVAAPVEEAKVEVEEKADEGKSLFSGWFGSSDNKAEEKVTESVEEAKAGAEEKADEGKSWFSGWFGGSDNKAAEVQSDTEVKSNEIKVAEAESVETENSDASEVKSWLNSWFESHSEQAE